ncbi:rhodanese-like domain-containing protein [Mucilaginibacter robiniae]|uniref:Rhodanese-like domain-containing protein n=1 Tax=Mucilaginibacter robiniae TaxID=2728022 RepID=A0A7L5E4U6_9SPHI|nr:rhodanese-like domain-containing protein [Mucilaginibacter robiniae]QJD98085.1 rhodanese-like domain-containing protein [Mucilaginibacter robiniae]
MNNSPSHHNPEISATELKQRLQNAENLFLLDVREPVEYHTYNIGGINIPLSKLAESLSNISQHQGDEIVLVCQAGLRSKTAQSILLENGYTQARNLTGGLLALRKLQQ